jgi:hypothetical protein
MPNEWVAVDAGTNRLSWARLLRRAYDVARRTTCDDVPAAPGLDPGIVRPVIAASWERSERAGVDPEELPPLVADPAAARRALRAHRLAGMVPVVDRALAEVARYAHQVASLADEDGLVLWTDGDPDAMEMAGHVHLQPGASWSEAVTGTNALGTALALDHPVQIFSAEQYKPRLHGWSAAAAPIHDPARGTLLGAVGLAGPLQAAHPHGLSLVAAAAQIVEGALRNERAERDRRLRLEYLERMMTVDDGASAIVNAAGRVLFSSPAGWLGRRLRLSPEGVPVPPAGEEVTIEPMPRGEGFLVARGGASPRGDRTAAPLRLEALGRERVAVVLGSRRFEATPRHSDILVILARHPDGVCEEDLARELYGAEVAAVTIRAEVCRLRKLLGDILRTGPYRLAGKVEADFLQVERMLRDGRAADAAAAYGGPLLPSSRAPAILELRDRLEAAVAPAPAAG